jgi:hypothetical protein
MRRVAEEELINSYRMEIETSLNNNWQGTAREIES